MRDFLKVFSRSKNTLILLVIFTASYFFFSDILAPNVTVKISAKNSAQEKFLSAIIGLSAEAANTYISIRPNGSGASPSCPAGSTMAHYQYDVGNTNSSVWKACYAPAPATGMYPATKLLWNGTNPYHPFNGAGYSCESGATYQEFIINTGNNYSAIWAACGSDTPVAAPVVAPPPPTITQASCTGTSITTSFSSSGALWYAVRLRDLSDGVDNTSCDPANGNDTCQWQTNPYLNRTGIAGHTYRMWVHAATNTSWSTGTVSGATYATDFSCPAVSSPVNGFCGSANGGTTSSPPTSGLCSSGSASPSTPSLSGSTYSWQCLGSGGGSNANCSSNYSSGVSAVPAPTLTFTANPTALPVGGGQTYLTWSTTNATSCVASNGWSGSRPTSGNNVSMTISGTTTFTLQCWNSNNSASVTQSATVTVASASGGASADIMINGLGAGFESRFTGTDNNPVNVFIKSPVSVTWTSSGRAYCITTVYDGGWQFITGTSENYSFTAPSTPSSALTFQTLCNNTNYGSGFSGYLGFSSAPDSIHDQISLVVSVPHGGETNLVGAMMSVDPLVPGNITFTGMVANAGFVNATVPFDNVFQIDMNNNGVHNESGDVTLTTPTLPFLTSGGSASRTATYNMSAGNYNARFCVDSGSVVTESEESNCSVNFPFTVLGGPSTASITVTVNCLPSGNCSADSRTTQLCSNQNFTIPDGCGGNMNCSGTRSCDFNWKEVAP